MTHEVTKDGDSQNYPITKESRVSQLLEIIEQQLVLLQRLVEEIQLLRDEIARMVKEYARKFYKGALKSASESEFKIMRPQIMGEAL